ncbi:MULTISPECIES: DNA translocase FtsK [Sutcliffiella]|uniref:Cell division protein FtsK n=1 Tax=Sutcliffiella cohnii TaxID=33932 RepID=A0A223KR83_9BACI|nr:MULTISPECIES: DNA translocase FtsK [Sutcliffiella]AST92001.1 cell division protein FtsK [Sutcliffiella cohnii]MED4015282.1 DNA translocase FtsK [Sutcliffiella cohnii]WBL13239.1 DNA translocase FtsK [Sutcliffiella sp. NC1]
MSKRKRRRKKQNRDEWKKTVSFEVIGLLLLALTFISIAKLGIVGQATVLFLRFFSGEWYMILLLAMLLLSGYIIWKRDLPPFFTRQLVGTYIIILSVLLLSHVALFQMLSGGGTFANPSVIANTWELFWYEVNGESSTTDLGGGMIGAVLFSAFHLLFDAKGAKWIAMIFIIIGIILVTGKSLNDTVIKITTVLFSFLKKQWTAFIQDMKNWRSQSKQQKKEKKEKEIKKDKKEKGSTEEVVEVTAATTMEEEVTPPIISSFTDNSQQEGVNEVAEKNAKVHQEEVEEGVQEVIPNNMAFTELENKDYELPSLDLLNKPITNHQTTEHENIYANARKLEKTFASFGVKAKVTKVHLGPAVTKYEVYPDVGVKVSKIVNLSDDLALALAAKDIRIEAPIPGKSAIGIEVPNNEVAMVSLREVLDVKLADRPDSKLLIGLGRDISGESVVAELNKMPHLLVAGATGSGKSVCINGIITSILMRAKPHEVKMMMIDPKMVELNVYNGVPHLLAPVVTNPKKASQALKKVVSEMERRYELFSHTGTRNIEGYNEYIRRHNQDGEAVQPQLPYIVVIVDELADLMMVASNEVEDCITRLAQMARAAGIHLIIATQRPSVDVITGVIKANIPSRIAFSVSSQTDSRTILDMGGAEKLLGRGDMLFLPVGASKPVRVQGAFLSDEEVERIVDFVIAQQKAQYQEEMIPQDVTEEVAEVEDELYDEAVQLVLEMQTASVSMLQRRFRVGYTRAARLIDAMEARGVVGPYEGSKPRTVLVQNNNEDVGS